MPQGWSIDPVADTITFLEPPAVGTNNISISEYAGTTFNSTAIWTLGAWNNYYGYPAEVEFFAGRLVFAATDLQPHTVWLSRIDDFTHFGKSTPIQDDDAISATLNARKRNRIRDLVPLQNMIVLTTGSEWRTMGSESDALTPTTISFRTQTSIGSSALPAILIDNSALFCQDQGYSLRDLSYSFTDDGYSGSDLSAFASHLVQNKQIVSWCYQSVPYSAVFAVRNDGVLLAMTYKKEHQVVAWSRLLTNGLVESVCCVPEDGQQALYMVVKRGAKRFVERLTPIEDDRVDWVGMDCSLSYDGRNTSATTMTLSTAGGWTVLDLITITASTAKFAANNVGDEVVLSYGSNPLRIRISAFQSSTVVKGYPSRDIEVALRTPGTSWALGLDTFAGLGHLEGYTVTVAGDGYRLADRIVVSGSITLDQPTVVAHVGLGFVANFESLDMTLVGGESVATRTKLLPECGVLVKDTQSIWVGGTFSRLIEQKPRDMDSPNAPPAEQGQWLECTFGGSWMQAPRVCIQCPDPFQASILAIEPRLEMGR